MPAFQFESNISVILLIIVIALVSLYFYLEIKKIKLINTELEKKNEMIIKEIDNIHLRLHKFFSGMPKSIVPQPKSNTNPPVKSNSNINNKTNNIKTDVESNKEKSNIVISENDFNNLKKNTSTNNIFGEIEEIVSNSNNIIGDDKIVEETKDIKLPELEPVNYDSDKLEVEENDEVQDIEEDDSEDENISEDLDEDQLEKYMKMSVKELKDICHEMGLKQSGNKTTLARRIVEKLE